MRTTDWGRGAWGWGIAVVCAGLVAQGAAAAPETTRRMEAVAGAVVGIRAHVPPSARTARGLGTVREGSGAIIDGNGLILTIGYLVLEARSVEVVVPERDPIPATIVGYDPGSGFGVVRSSVPLAVEPMSLGESGGLRSREPVLVVANRGLGVTVSPAVIASRRNFAGYWEYLLEDAIFTMPAAEDFAGAALVDADFRLVGIGSLFVGDALGNEVESPGNMFVPIDTLKPILADLLAQGRPAAPPRPWLGLHLAEQFGRLIVTRVLPDGPARAAGVQRGDIILELAGAPVERMEAFYRGLWALGDAGVDVPLQVLQGNRVRTIRIASRDRFVHYRFPSGP